MKERPILFSGPMVRAIREGRKTQTRRMIKDQSIGERFSHMTDNGMAHLEWVGQPRCGSGVWDVPEYSADVACPYGQPGDRLWVREAWRVGSVHNKTPPRNLKPKSMTVIFEAGGSLANDCTGKWVEDAWPRPNERPAWAGKYRTPMFMPRWASRILLEIVSVRVERLNDISDADAVAEGVERWRVGPDNWWVDYSFTEEEAEAGVPPALSATESYRTLWESINGAGGWEANPWVWCVEFKRVEGGA